MATRTAMDDALEQAVDAGRVPGVVAMAADEGGLTYQGAFGSRAAGGETPMTLDTVFWIASMTKAITSVAALQQVEQGTLDLDAPLGDVLPQLAAAQVLEGFDASGAPILRPARRPITLRLLLTHTAGFTYNIWSPEMSRYMEHTGMPGIITCQNVCLDAPLMFDPGERWEYGINIDWAGRAVEQVTGLNLNEYFRQHIFTPLAMTDTGLVLGPDQRSRLVSMHARTGERSFDVIPFEVPQEPEFFMGGGGLYSTAHDYLTFLQALLHGGSFSGAQILKPETVAEANRNQIGDLAVGLLKTADPFSSYDAELFPGAPKKWGLAYMLNVDEVSTGRSAGSLAWAGLANTYYWLDPTRKVAGVILTQILPFADPIVLDLFGQFERAVYGVDA